MRNIHFLKQLGGVAVLIVILFGCSEPNDNCLQYEGELYRVGKSCSGIVIKVTNRDVDSRWYDITPGEGRKLIENAIGITLGPTSTSIDVFDSSLMGKKFYFNFRERLPEDFNSCLSIYDDPTRVVFVTELSLTKCPVTED